MPVVVKAENMGLNGYEQPVERLRIVLALRMSTRLPPLAPHIGSADDFREPQQIFFSSVACEA
jgi:hypothetical protein